MLFRISTLYVSKQYSSILPHTLINLPGYTLLPATYEVWGEVMFSKVFVCSQWDLPSEGGLPSEGSLPSGEGVSIKADPLQVSAPPPSGKAHPPPTNTGIRSRRSRYAFYSY